ncbi:MAG: pyridine nucleotide-disulfide oxidoreductase, partial [Clostridia bacterium]
GGAIVDENMMTNIDGVFECGNVLHVHDLVDYVSQESQLAGVAAVEYLNKVKSSQQEKWQIVASDGVRYCVPFVINKDTTASCIALKIRVATVAKNVRLVLSCGATILSDQKKPIVRPGEMIVFNLEMRLLEQLKGADTIKVYLQSDKA